MPLSRPIRGVDGQLIAEVPVPKGTTILVGVRASNRNPELWGPDAKEWKPERWLEKLPESVTDAHLPGVYSNLWVEMFRPFGMIACDTDVRRLVKDDIQRRWSVLRVSGLS